jgi:hypothetical protein
MPRAKIEGFDAAVKHLFRHFDDPKRLRSNPLARPFLPNVSLLKAHVIELAKKCRESDVDKRDNERGVRQYEIFRLYHIAKLPLPEIAATLEISLKHCYRERAAMYRKIGRHLLRSDGHSLVANPRDDDFFALLSRLTESDATDSNGGIQALKYLERVAESPQHRAAAASALGMAQLLQGLVVDMPETLRRIKPLVQNDLDLQSVPDRMLDIIRVSSGLLEASVTQYRRQFDTDSLQNAIALTNIANRIPLAKNRYAQTVWLVAQQALSSALWGEGRLADAYDVANHAQTVCDRLGFHGFYRFHVENELWRMRTYLVTSKTSHFTIKRRLEGLRAAFETSKACGSFVHAVGAMVAIVDCCGLAGNDDGALRAARTALYMSRRMNSPIFVAQVNVEIAVRLLRTSHWRYALALMAAKNVRPDIGSYRLELMRLGLALAALRLGKPEEAKRWAAGEKTVAPATMGLRRRIAEANALHSLGNEKSARELAEESLVTAERLGSSPILGEAFVLASTVLSTRKFSSPAAEIARVFAA